MAIREKMKLLGEIAYETAPDSVDTHCLSNSQSKVIELTKWGEKIVKELKKRGYYINKVKGDPSGRW